jgi:cytochrome c peroxidase
MSFLMAWAPRTNPMIAGRAGFTDEERRGASLFRERCEGCHQARAAADEASTRVAFAEWEKLVFRDNGPLVWACDAYEKTGVEPYVHEKGARVPSLRRLYKKRPYFTNGSAKTVLDVLDRARFSPFSHEGRTDGDRLPAADARAIAAFLDLL